MEDITNTYLTTPNTTRPQRKPSRSTKTVTLPHESITSNNTSQMNTSKELPKPNTPESENSNTFHSLDKRPLDALPKNLGAGSGASIPKKKTSSPQKALRTKASRLDVLDNSHLTSFPLAPPPPKMDNLANRSPEINAIECTFSDSNSFFFEVDPIVLVEDYIKRQELSRKKLSVLDLKRSMKFWENDEDGVETNDSNDNEINYIAKCRSILLSNTPKTGFSIPANDNGTYHNRQLLTENIIDLADMKFDLESTTIYQSTTSEFSIPQTSSPSFNSIISMNTPRTSAIISSDATIRLSDDFDEPIPEFSLNNIDQSLKYCIICETPLYDLSSHLAVNDSYKEFVCCDCTERYEALSKLVEDFDEKMGRSEPIPGSIENIEQALHLSVSGKRNIATRSAFSVMLITTLQRQLNDEEPYLQKTNELNQRNVLWLLEAKKKLRWRWRISGLLPSFLCGN